MTSLCLVFKVLQDSRCVNPRPQPPFQRAGAKSHETGKVVVRQIDSRDRDSLQKLVNDFTAEGATVYTDEAKGYIAWRIGSTNRSITRRTGMSSVRHTRMEWSPFGLGSNGDFIPSSDESEACCPLCD